MKKYAAAAFLLACAAGLAGCAGGPDSMADTPEFSEAASYTQEQLGEKLAGLLQEEMHDAWGEPDGMLSGFLGDYWYLDRDSGSFITLYYDGDGQVEAVVIGNGTEETEGAEQQDLTPMVMVNGTLYLDTGRESTVEARCGLMDGEITSQVDGSQRPTIDGQSNFGTGYGYQYGPREGTIEVYINDTWRVFAAEGMEQEIPSCET